MKEVLPVAARALRLTLQPWEVRAADDFDRVFAAMGKQRPDGLYVPGGGPLMRANQKRIVGFALKSRLPSVYGNREAVDAGGLMSYGADHADSYRRVAYLRGQNPERSQACGPAGRATDKVRAGDQSQNREADRSHDSAERAGAGGQGDQVKIGIG